MTFSAKIAIIHVSEENRVLRNLISTPPIFKSRVAVRKGCSAICVVQILGAIFFTTLAVCPDTRSCIFQLALFLFFEADN